VLSSPPFSCCQQARPTRTAFETFREGVGVCRDYAHLAIALCRAMNLPTRYCSGYISDVGLPPPYAPMDFCAWFEAWLDTLKTLKSERFIQKPKMTSSHFAFAG
jgi:transglutaminase-like putative cysteine protease